MAPSFPSAFTLITFENGKVFSEIEKFFLNADLKAETGLPQRKATRFAADYIAYAGLFLYL